MTNYTGNHEPYAKDYDRSYAFAQFARLHKGKISVVISDEFGNNTNRMTLTAPLLELITERLAQMSEVQGDD